MEIPSAAVVSAIAALAGGLVFVFKIFMTRWENSEKRHDECEKKHDATQETLLEVSKEVGELKGRVKLAEEIGPKIDRLADALESKN